MSDLYASFFKKLAAWKTVFKALFISLLKTALWALAFWLLLSRVFDFSDRHALGLALIFALIVSELRGMQKTPTSFRFRPHQVKFHPHLYPMLLDLGFVKDADEYQALVGEGKPWHPWSDTHIFFHWVRAYVITYDEGSQDRLIHFPELSFYSNKLEFGAQLKPIYQVGELGEWAPELFVKPWFDNYRIGIRAKEKWWNENKAKIAPGLVLHEDKEYQFGTVRLTLALLPATVFHEYFIDVSRDYGEHVKETAKAAGWKHEMLGGGDLPYYGDQFEHKYMTVWLQDLD